MTKHVGDIKKKNSKQKKSPTQEHIQMVEDTLSEMKIYPTRQQLYKSLPQKIQHQSFNIILEGLEDSNKMIYDKDGTIVWIFSDGGVKENHSLVCCSCGYKSQDVKEFVINGGLSGLNKDFPGPLIIEEKCLNCDAKENKYTADEDGLE